MALAAILHQEADEPGQGRINGAVDDEPPLAPGPDQPGVFEMGQVEGEPRGARAAHSLPDGPGGHALRPGLHQEPHDTQPRLLGKGSKGGQSTRLIHRINPSMDDERLSQGGGRVKELQLGASVQQRSERLLDPASQTSHYANLTR